MERYIAVILVAECGGMKRRETWSVLTSLVREVVSYNDTLRGAANEGSGTTAKSAAREAGPDFLVGILEVTKVEAPKCQS